MSQAEGGIQALDALMEAVWRYEIPIVEVFTGRVALLEMVRLSLELDRITVGEGRATTNMKAKERVLRECATGRSAKNAEGGN